MKKWLSVLLSVCLLTTLLVPGTLAASDDALQTVRALGIINGDENGSLYLDNTVTRAEFVKMMVAASNYRDSVSEVSGVSPFRDVPYTHWAANYVRVAVDEGWVTGYTDGTFRPDQTITLEEAATAVLRMLGYSSSDLSGIYPYAQLSKFQTLGLKSGISASQGQQLTREDCVSLFYNLMSTQTAAGQTYATSIGYTLNSAGQVDYAAVIEQNTTGPFVAGSDWQSAIPFSLTSATILRNGSLTTAAAIDQYDVLYYNESLRIVWAYSNRVTGTYTSASPSTASPSAVTVAGTSYPICSSSAAYALSDRGTFPLGSTVTLLLDRDDQVAGVVSPSEAGSTHYGLVTAQSVTSLSSSNGSTIVQLVSVLCTDGVTRQFSISRTSCDVGDLICVDYSSGTVQVSVLKERTLTGSFNKSGTTFAGYSILSTAQILEVSSGGNSQVLYPAQLAGVTLRSGDVFYYTTDEDGAIDRMILEDVTGDLNSYGIITAVSENTERPISGSYVYLIDGKAGSYTTSGLLFHAKTGPALFSYDDGTMSSIRALSAVSISSISGNAAATSGSTYTIADGCDVYLKVSDSSYVLTDLTAVSDADTYTLKGYYDDMGYSAGGKIRVIIAVD